MFFSLFFQKRHGIQEYSNLLEITTYLISHSNSIILFKITTEPGFEPNNITLGFFIASLKK
jgi:hypothetical protein